MSVASCHLTGIFKKKQVQQYNRTEAVARRAAVAGMKAGVGKAARAGTATVPPAVGSEGAAGWMDRLKVLNGDFWHQFRTRTVIKTSNPYSFC